MKIYLLLILLFHSVVFAKDESISVDLAENLPSTAVLKQKNSLSVLQDQIEKCQLNIPAVGKIKTFQDLYKAIDKKYILLSEKTIEREVLYSVHSDQFKLKVVQDKITILKIDDEGKMTPASFDAKQKIGTVRGRVKQLLLNAKIDEDWAQYFEQRERGIQLEYSVRDFNMTKLNIKMPSNKQILDCERKSTSEVCYCNVMTEK